MQNEINAMVHIKIGINTAFLKSNHIISFNIIHIKLDMGDD